MNYKHLSGHAKNKIWLWTAVNHGTSGILAWVIGDRSAETFKQLWKIVRGWQSFWYATDGYAVYAKFIDETSHIVSKTYMTREKAREYAIETPHRSVTSKNFVLFKVCRDVGGVHPLTTSLSKVLDYPSTCLNHDLIVQRLH